MVEVYAEKCPNYSTVTHWVRKFKSGFLSVMDEPREGRPTSVVTEKNVSTVEGLVKQDRRITVKQFASETRISVGSVEKILHDHLNLNKVSARWVPRLLTADQKKESADCCKHLLRLEANDDLLFQKIVTMDETWIYQFDPEPKNASMQWKRPSSPPPKKAKVTQSSGKVMLSCFWDSPSDFCLFPNLKKSIKGRRFEDIEDAISAVEEWFQAQNDTFYSQGLLKVKDSDSLMAGSTGIVLGLSFTSGTQDDDEDDDDGDDVDDDEDETVEQKDSIGLVLVPEEKPGIAFSSTLLLRSLSSIDDGLVQREEISFECLSLELGVVTVVFIVTLETAVDVIMGLGLKAKRSENERISVGISNLLECP
ncbi:hypothetical protein EGW08_013698 [Elysia chlorotica]|uniref:Mos1 transposase HTH domain-containing protein n=1 Tax=Elysia chlorotica TaxID=188477 RepID=A0A433TAE2_ELYCH|nr:hypothetical protein EGW08_013698 [Elysia chlorotica]